MSEHPISFSGLFPKKQEAAPAQEHVAWGVFEGGNLHDTFFSKEEAEHMALLKGSHAEVRPLYTTPPAAREEPVAFFDPQGKGFYWAKPTKITAPVTVDVEPLPLYTTPPAAQRQWVEVEQIKWEGDKLIAKLKEKNNG